MLQIILGRAGSGKTSFARDFFINNKERILGHKQFLIVPEQYSFDTEKAMLEKLGAQSAGNVNVMSFSRLSDLFFRTHGGIAGKRLTDGGRAAFMQLALDEVADKLNVYKKPALTGDIIELMISSASEMKMSGISTDFLLGISERLEDGELKEKTKEISYILSAYNALIQRSYVDPEDDLTRMSEMLRETDFFKGSYVVIDSFSGFTAQEMMIIKHMLKSAEEVYITFCTDDLYNEDGGTDVFLTVKKTAVKVISAAKELGVHIKAPKMLESGKRFISDEIKFAERFLFSPNFERYGHDAADILVYKASDIYDESEYVASMIHSLVKSGNYRYRDIAVIARNTDPYIGILDVALEKRDIFYFMDKPEHIELKPLFRLVLSALKIAGGSFTGNDILNYIKTGLVGISSDETALLQNYTYIWDISGKSWFSKWNENPSGLGKEMTEEDKKLLVKLNKLRIKTVSPLKSFIEHIADNTGDRIAEGLYNLLCDAKVTDNIAALCAKFDEEGNAAASAEQMRMWELLMKILDESANILGNDKTDTTKFMKLLTMVFKTETISDIPNGVDEVTVGSAERIRTSSPKVVFLLGVVRGLFPLVPGDSGLFSDRERKELIGVGLPIGRTFEDSSVEERFITYEAAFAPSEKLFMSFASESGAYPSEMIDRAVKIFGDNIIKEKKDYSDEFFASSKATAFSLAARQWSKNDVKSAALRDLFNCDEEYKGLANALQRAAFQKPIKIENNETAKRLFSGDHKISATQIETYYMCKFRYFCQFGVKAKEIRPAVIDPLQYGNLMHYLLEKLFLSNDSEKVFEMSEEALRSEINTLCETYAQLNFGGSNEKSKRFISSLERLADSAYYLIRHISKELSQSKFSPIAFELPVGSGEIQLSIPIDDNKSVSVAGKIDRVDNLYEDGKKYIRVIDYKTGVKEFKLSDILFGINLQMFMYLAAITESSGALPAGVLYMPSARPLINTDRDTKKEEIDKEIEKAFRMNGVVLNDDEVLHAMEENLEGKYIPVSVNGEKRKGTESLLSEEEFNIVIKEIKKKTLDMYKGLINGDIDAAPLMKNKFGCSFCPYFSVCERVYDESDVEKLSIKRDGVIENIMKEGL